MSYYKYIRECTYEEIVKELDIKECKDIFEVYNYFNPLDLFPLIIDFNFFLPKNLTPL